MEQTLDLSGFQFPDRMNIRLASLFLDMSEMRVRTLLREEKIKAEKVDGTWVITKEALEAYKADRASGATRKTGGTVRGTGKAWIIRVPFQKLEEVKAFLGGHGIELEPRYNYERQKAYQLKRKAEKQAEKEAAREAAGEI